MTLEFKEYCARTGLEHEPSPRYRKEHNGVVERSIQTIGNGARAMMHHGNAPERDFKYAVKHALFCKNDSMTKANKLSATPNATFEGVSTLPPSRRILKAPLFCLAYPVIYDEERRKHGNRASPAIYLGVESSSSAYLFRDIRSGRSFFNADAVWHCNTFPYRPTITIAPTAVHAPVEGVEADLKFNDNAPIQMPGEMKPITAQPDNDKIAAPEEHKHDASNTQTGMQLRTTREPSARALDNIASMTVSSTTAHTESNNKTATIPWRLQLEIDQGLEDGMPDPTTWEEALASDDAPLWLEADADEAASHRHHGTWRLVPPTPGVKVYKCKRVMKRKRDEMGRVTRYKVRWTVAAYKRVMKQGIDYSEKYAATARWETYRVLIAIAVHKGWPLHLIDVKTFFLYGELPEDERIHMQQVSGHEVKGKEDWVCLVLKSIYGHPAASHHAQRKLKKCLTGSQVFRQCVFDSCLYILDDGTDVYFLCTHVDDMLGSGTSGGHKKAIQCLKSVFEIKVTTEPKLLLGVAIERDYKNRKAKLHQGTYVRKLLADEGMLNCNPTRTPMDVGLLGTVRRGPLKDAQSDSGSTGKEFQRILGKITWLLKTRPDIQFAAAVLARFSIGAGETELKYAKRVLRYLAGSPDRGIIVDGNGPLDISGGCDADWGGDLRTDKSTSGTFSKLGRTLVCTQVKLQRKVADSTAMAKTYAAHEELRTVTWLFGLCGDMGLRMSRPARCVIDNAAAHKQGKNPVNHAASKHYRLPQAIIRQGHEDNLMTLVKVASDDNPADVFTKPLDAVKFHKHIDALMGSEEKFDTRA